MRWWDAITDSMDVNLSNLQKIVKDREAWCAAVHWVSKRWTQLSNRTATIYIYIYYIFLCIILYSFMYKRNFDTCRNVPLPK